MAVVGGTEDRRRDLPKSVSVPVTPITDTQSVCTERDVGRQGDCVDCMMRADMLTC